MHGISISIRQLKRYLKNNRLSRKITPTADHNITVISLVMVANNTPIGIYNTLTFEKRQLTLERAKGIRKFGRISDDAEAISKEI